MSFFELPKELLEELNQQRAIINYHRKQKSKSLENTGLGVSPAIKLLYVCVFEDEQVPAFSPKLSQITGDESS